LWKTKKAKIREPQSLSRINLSIFRSNLVIIGKVALVALRSRVVPFSKISPSSRLKKSPFLLILNRMRSSKKTIFMCHHPKITRNISEKKLMQNILEENSWPVAPDKMASFLRYIQAQKVVQTPKFRTSPCTSETHN